MGKQTRAAAVVLAVALLAGAAPAHGVPADYGALTCAGFVASGPKNMGYILWWLRGYHAGRRGVPEFNPKDDYAARLGYYCRNHPRARLLDASERILSQLDRGI